MSGTRCKSARIDSTECQLQVHDEHRHPVVSMENSPRWGTHPECWLHWFSHSGTPPCGRRWSGLQVHQGPPGCVGVCVALWWKPCTVCVSPRLPGGRVGREPQISGGGNPLRLSAAGCVECWAKSAQPPAPYTHPEQPQPSHTVIFKGASGHRGETAPRFRFQLCTFCLSGPKTRCLEKATAGEPGVEHYNTGFLCRHMFTAHSSAPCIL